MISEILEKCDYTVSTDTRKNISGSVFFALRGENFDGNKFIEEALQKGALAVITDDPDNEGENVYVVENVLKTLQEAAVMYRKKFNIPIIVVGGSNGKTTSKDLIHDVLKTKYKVQATEGSLNNHIGVPLTLLSLKPDTEIAILEIGANHPGEHTELLNIIQPTHVVVTNNGMDHLEGFQSPSGVRQANKEIYDWDATAFVNKKHPDLLEDSKKDKRILYPEENLETASGNFLTIMHASKSYATNLVGDYNIENIELALAVGKYFNIETEKALAAICGYTPLSKRSQLVAKNNITFIVDCYNANPTSMKASLKSFFNNTNAKKGIILGDMLELGSYSDIEHKKIVEYVSNQKPEAAIFIGPQFKKALKDELWFPDSETAKTWFAKQNFDGFTFLLKGSRGMQIEKILS